MIGIVKRTLFACATLLLMAGAAQAQQTVNECEGLKLLLQAAKDGFTQVRDYKMPGAANCTVYTDTRSYGCMWMFEKSAAASAGYERAVHTVNSCFPNVAPKRSRSTRGTLHTEYDLGQALIDVSRGTPGKMAGDWYSIDIIAP